LLIAEISNHHNGDTAVAKKLIDTAKECGADAVKGQAFRAKDMLSCGTMSLEFYQRCQLTSYDYRFLIQYGKQIGTEVFFTVLSQVFYSLKREQKYLKIHAAKSERSTTFSIFPDDETTIISVRQFSRKMKKMKHAKFLLASNYFENLSLEYYCATRERFGRDLGVSWHGDTWDLINFIRRSEHFIPVIEKHFYLGDTLKDVDGKKIYRDCLISSPPGSFAMLAQAYKAHKERFGKE